MVLKTRRKVWELPATESRCFEEINGILAVESRIVIEKRDPVASGGQAAYARVEQTAVGSEDLVLPQGTNGRGGEGIKVCLGAGGSVAEENGGRVRAVLYSNPAARSEYCRLVSGPRVATTGADESTVR